MGRGKSGPEPCLVIHRRRGLSPMHPVLIQTERASIGPDAREWTVSCRYDDKAVWGGSFGWIDECAAIV